ncbi:hypothetical protein ElyMa_004464900 [Elysia marginata]|uniref:Uncharacterized protein n=1 Tax=Elysia marginata TaxID=1093978 RepID=A0AAV4HIG5_9GAST|nr:hypothetical protein ElyMa_004464900 [Elysia marginata]
MDITNSINGDRNTISSTTCPWKVLLRLSGANYENNSRHELATQRYKLITTIIPVIAGRCYDICPATSTNSACDHTGPGKLSCQFRYLSLLGPVRLIGRSPACRKTSRLLLNQTS